LDAVFVMQHDERSNQVGAGIPPFAPLPMAVSAGGIVGGKATVDGVLRIDLESRTSAAAAASRTAPAHYCVGRRLSGGRLSLDCGKHAEEGCESE
jgi:hypothetical protein